MARVGGRRWFSMLTIVAFFVIAITGTALAASRNNVLFPNGCRIDEWNGYSLWRDQADGKTHEDYGCELIKVKMRYYDPNRGFWVTGSSAWSAGDSNRDVRIHKYTDRVPAWTDHLGKANGIAWGQKLWY